MNEKSYGGLLGDLSRLRPQSQPSMGLLGFGPTVLPPQAEMQFQSWARGLPWYSQFQQRFGEAPNLSDSQYDYRAAYSQGIRPTPDPYDQNFPHWPSTAPDGRSLKIGAHPTAWKEEFMKRTGKNPDAVGIMSPEQASHYVGDGSAYLRLR